MSEEEKLVYQALQLSMDVTHAHNTTTSTHMHTHTHTHTYVSVRVCVYVGGPREGGAAEHRSQVLTHAAR